MTKHEQATQIEDLKAEVAYWRTQYAQAIKHDRRVITKLKEGMDVKRFEQAPCYRCGYNGPGYYQIETHPCAHRYHQQNLKEAQDGTAE